VLINSSGYVAARTMEQAQQELDRIDTAVVAANKAGLTVYCGHGLTARNIRPLAELEAIDEFVVGHALFARAISVGYDRAVRDLLAEIRIHRPVA